MPRVAAAVEGETAPRRGVSDNRVVLETRAILRGDGIGGSSAGRTVDDGATAGVINNVDVRGIGGTHDVITAAIQRELVEGVCGAIERVLAIAGGTGDIRTIVAASEREACYCCDHHVGTIVAAIHATGTSGNGEIVGGIVTAIEKVVAVTGKRHHV